MQLLARYNITSALDEHHQDLQGLFLEVDLSVVGPQFSRLSIELEVCRTKRAWHVGAEHHASPRSARLFYDGSRLPGLLKVNPLSPPTIVRTASSSVFHLFVIHLSARFY